MNVIIRSIPYPQSRSHQHSSWRNHHCSVFSLFPNPTPLLLSSMASRGPCYCSICILDMFEDDDGNIVSGKLQTAKTRRQHEISDAKWEKQVAQQTARVEAQVMAATLDGGVQRAGSSSVVRPRDCTSSQPHGNADEAVCPNISSDQSNNGFTGQPCHPTSRRS